MVSDKTSLRRHPERSVADDELIHRILDEGFLCHVGYLTEGRPVVIPTLYARDGARILLHGSPSSGIVRAVRKNSPLSVAVTHLDGLVVARSAFESSANYRSVVIHGFGEILKGKAHEDALNLITDHLIPGRRDDVRPNHIAEVKQTSTVSLSLDEVSTKVRTGPPDDDPADLDAPIWAGVIPIELAVGEPEPAPNLGAGIKIPDYLNPYTR
jgi:nitroimidazol reductase NimA-like FMN-containing flavoprotein (pyridoxamine 5'-phosphate oxidase superfamily)